MKREWKPGDVALVARLGAPATSAHPAMFTTHGWCCRSAGLGCDGEPIRPVVVIDPEDREQVEWLRDALGRDSYYGTLGLLQAALRSLVAPPRPEEPTGLGAVVEDAEGRRWVRTGHDRYPWGHFDRDESGDSYTDATTYADLDVVRVLHAGWEGEA